MSEAKIKERRDRGSGSVSHDASHKKEYKAVYTLKNGHKKVKRFEDRDAALEWLDEIAQNKEANDMVIEKGAPFNDYADKYLEHAKKEYAKKSGYEAERVRIKRAQKYLGIINIRDIDNQVISDMIRQMKGDGKKKPFATQTISQTKNAVLRVLKFAINNGHLKTMPVIVAKVKEKSKVQEDISVKNGNWLEEDEIKRYEEECVRTYSPKCRHTKNFGNNIPVHPSARKLLLLLHTGIRIGECLSLEWDDYDESSQTLSINKNLINISREKEIVPPKTKAGKRVIVLNKQAVDDILELKRQFDEQSKIIDQKEDEELSKAKRAYKGNELTETKRQIANRYETIRNNHKNITPSITFPFGYSCEKSSSDTHKKILKAISIDRNLTLHGLRHTYVTHFYNVHHNDTDWDPLRFSKSIGHTSVRTTQEIYTHLNLNENKTVKRSYSELKDF